MYLSHHTQGCGLSPLPATLRTHLGCIPESAASTPAFSLSRSRSLARSLTLAHCSNNIKSIPEELGALTKLREVYFNGNPISTLPAALAGWGSLEEGSFKFCKLKALPP